MSDAMSNREIEDVLSSIRRLVAREASRPAPGRLVLTEAQRIAVNDSAAPASAATEGGAAGDDGAAGNQRAQLQAAIAGLGAAADPRASGDDPGSDSAHETGLPALGEFSSAADRPPGADSGHETQGSTADAEARQETREAPAADTRRGEGADEGATGAAQTDEDDYGEAEEWHGPARYGQGQGNADDAETDDADSGDEEAGSDDAAALADTLIDEDMLRALVAQLVREELRGQLGERITLLVRKLVRAEIARALDEREYL
ncbi:MAG: hypothetical protein JJT95_13635 [Pararhodobacter sp.]|nr:hypothetical protein [Pararhodobacter sp.]